MQDEFKQLIDALSDARLSDEEKSKIRSHLRTFIHEHPARAPFYIRALDSVLNFEQAFKQPQLQFAAATLAFLFVVGSGTAYAAGNSLPGEPLYTVKVNIEEPIQGAFATTAQAQASWNAQLAGRRLAEAEQLAAQNKLTPSTESAVAQGLDQATVGFDTNVAQLATSSNNTVTVATLDSDMESTLASSTQALNQIASAVPSAAPSIAPLVTRLQGREASLNAQLDASVAEAVSLSGSGATSSIAASTTITIATSTATTTTSATSTTNGALLPLPLNKTVHHQRSR